MSYKIDKIKLDKKGFPEIHYTEDGKYGDPVCKLNGIEKSEVLEASLQKLMKTGIEWCRLSDDWEEFGRVSGVSLKHVEGDIGVTIILRGDFQEDDGARYCINVNSPYLNPDRLTTAEHLILVDICTEAANYLKGQPQQLSLVA